MKAFIAAAGFAAGASAAVVARDGKCCFTLTASGGASGPLSQLSDGQNRIGGSGSPATYCIDNGGITDSMGRGCILTPPTTQFQCDTGASPTTGFSISSSGEVEYKGSSTFYACPATDNGMYNIYTTPVANQPKCVKVELSTGGKCVPQKPTMPKPTMPKPSPSMPANTCPPAMTVTVTEKAPAPATVTVTEQGKCPAPTCPEMPAPTCSCPECPAPKCPAPTTVYDCKTSPMAPPPPETMAPPPETMAPPPETMAPPPETMAPPPETTMPAPPAPPAPMTTKGSPPPPGPYKPSQPVSMPSPPPSKPSGCPTDLSGSYQYPHLIVPVSSSQPDHAYGTQYNATITPSECTIFNFDIPQSYQGETCSVVFLFPEQSQLQTSSYDFSGSGSLVFSSLRSPANQQTTWNNCPAKKQQLGSVSPMPGNSYSIYTGMCAAGTTQSIEVCGTNGLSLTFFEDYNPSPIGVYITSC